MSLLNWGTESVTLYPSVQSTDEDGDTTRRPSTEGVETFARVQPMEMSESQVRGYHTEQLYRLIIARPQVPVLDAFSAVQWRGERYEISEPPAVYSGSPRTARAVYVMRRA